MCFVIKHAPDTGFESLAIIAHTQHGVLGVDSLGDEGREYRSEESHAEYNGQRSCT